MSLGIGSPGIRKGIMHEAYKECRIGLKRLKYDFCCDGTRKEAKAFLPDMKYLGSGFVTYLNGKKEEHATEKHFFIFKTASRSQVQIGDRLLGYDVCIKGSEEDAKATYPNDYYLGASTITYHRGVRNEDKEVHHFFVKKKIKP